MGWTHETVRKSRLPAFLTSHAPPYTLPLETGEVFAALAAEIAEGAEFTRLQNFSMESYYQGETSHQVFARQR